MLQAITKRLKRGRRGISTVIVVMLSLVLVVVIVGNVVLWNYQMNQVDMDRMQETLSLTNVTGAARSEWVTAQNEYTINAGTRLNGTYADTQAIDSSNETFIEEPAPTTYRLDIVNSYKVNLQSYPKDYINGFEVLLRYNVSSAGEKWFLKAYNWVTASFSDAGFNASGGNQPVLGEWNTYAVAVTGNWTDYINAEGIMRIEFFDEDVSPNQTVVDLDFFGVRAIMGGALLEIKNSSPLTIHVVAVWVTDAAAHNRYDVSWFLNSGENAKFSLDISLPQDAFIAKVITERGNAAVFSSG
jgi:hypothetical protein